MSYLEPEGITFHISTYSRKKLAQFFRRTVSDQLLAELVGAIDDAAVEITCDGRRFQATIKHELIVEQYRVVGSASEFGYFINNVFFELTADAPEGLGLLSFARQVSAALRLDFSFIRTFADGSFADSNGLIGYYVWARFGFNAPLEPGEIAALPDELAGCVDLNDVMLRGGHDWWRQGGAARDMIFMLGEDEPCVTVLRNYLAEKGVGFQL